jgi:hypothetical protein
MTTEIVECSDCGMKVRVDITRIEQAICPKCKCELLDAQCTETKCVSCGGYLFGNEIGRNELAGMCLDCAREDEDDFTPLEEDDEEDDDEEDVP